MIVKRTQQGTWKHFHQRLLERYNLIIDHQEWLDLREQITNGHKNAFVGRKSNSKTWWLIRYKEQPVLALYCQKTNGFLSCLPIIKLIKALEGNPSFRKYLGLTSDSIMLRSYQEGKLNVRN